MQIECCSSSARFQFAGFYHDLSTLYDAAQLGSARLMCGWFFMESAGK